MKKGTTRAVFFCGRWAIKVPRVYRWKLFLRGLLANMDERMWFNNSPLEWKLNMCPSLFCIGGFILICKRATPISVVEYEKIDFKKYHPLSVDKKIDNFGLYDNRIVLVDYADSRYMCSDCELFFGESNK